MEKNLAPNFRRRKASDFQPAQLTHLDQRPEEEELEKVGWEETGLWPSCASELDHYRPLLLRHCSATSHPHPLPHPADGARSEGEGVQADLGSPKLERRCSLHIKG